MANKALEADFVTYMLYFVYFWFGLLTLFIFSSCIIKYIYSFVLFIAQYWLRAYIYTEGMGLLSLEKLEFFFWDVKAYVCIEGIGVSLFDPFSNTFLRLGVNRTRVEYIHSLPPPNTPPANRWYHRLIPNFSRTHISTDEICQPRGGPLKKVLLLLARLLLPHLQIDFCLFEMLVSHEAHTQLYAILTSANTLVSFRPFSPDKYNLDVSLRAREAKVSLEMRSGQPVADVPSLLSFKGCVCLKLCYNSLYAHPLTHLEAATADTRISCLQKSPEILSGFLKIFFVSQQFPNNHAPFSPSRLLRRATGWRYFPSSLSLLSEDCTASYLAFSGQLVRLSWRQLLLELRSKSGLLRNVSSSSRHRGDRRGTGLRFLGKLSAAKVETGSSEHVLSLSSLLCEVELNPPEKGGGDKSSAGVGGLARRLKGLVWRGGAMEGESSPAGSDSRADLTVKLELQSIYFVLDPVLISNFLPLDFSSYSFPSGEGEGLYELVTSELSQFASRQISASAEDAVLAFYHSEPLIRSKQPLFKLVLAQCSTALLLPPSASRESPHGSLTLSTRNLYLHTPGVASGPDSKTEAVDLLASLPDSLQVLPDSGEHLWGRCFECASLSSKLSIAADDASSLSVVIAVDLANLEISRHGMFAFEWLLSALMPLPDTSNQSVVIPVAFTRHSISMSASINNLNLFLYDISPHSPALLLHTDSLSSQLSDQSLVLAAGNSGLLPIQVEEQRFAVSTLANLPQGLLELKSLSAVLSKGGEGPRLLELGSEAAALHWTPTRHCHLSESVSALRAQGLEASRFFSARYPRAANNVNSPLFSVDNEPTLCKEGREYRSFLGQVRSKLDVSCGCKKLHVSIRPDPNTSVNFEFGESFACLKSGQLSMSAPSLNISMDKREVVSFTQILLIRMNSPPLELSQPRSRFPEVEWPSNYPIAISFQRLAVVFPYKYNVAVTVHKLTNILKFLRRTHFPVNPDSSRLAVPPDLVLSVGEIVIDFPDDGFEVKLRGQYELKSDESLEKAHRRQLMDEKVREIRSQEGELGTSDKIEALQGSLVREDSTVYINRARAFYQKNPLRHWLLRIKLSQSSLSVLADPSLQGRDNLTRRLKEINPASLLPSELPFSILWGRYTKGSVAKCELFLRDYPQPLTSIHSLAFSGTVLGAERRGGPLSVREACVDIFPPWEPFKLSLNICPLKFFHDLSAEASKIDFAWGAAFEPAWLQVGEAAEMLYLPSLDPSPPLPFWDRIRIKRHGTFRLCCDKFTLYLLSSRDPYNNTESLVVEMKKFSGAWEDCRLRFEGEVGFFLSTASKYDDCRLAYLPRAELEIKMIWETEGDSSDHHHICPVNRSKVTPPVPDSYALFRSSSLDLSIQLSIQSSQREGKLLTPKFVCYASTIRWLKNFQNNFLLNVTRPTRRGSVWLNVRPPKKKLSRHYRSVSFSSQLCACQLSYWSSYAHRKGVTVLVNGLELDSEFRLAIKAIADGLIHRPAARFKVFQCQISSSEIRVKACSCNMADTTRMKRIEFVTVNSISYRYNADAEKEGADSPNGESEFKHHVEANKVRILWNCFVRTLVLNLYESYENSRILRKNLSTEVLRNIAVLKKSLQQAAMAEHTPVNHAPTSNTFHKPSRKTLELDRFLELRDKSHSHEDLVRSGQQEERTICENKWLVQLMEIQVALCCEREQQGEGESAEGWLLVTSAHSFVTGMLNEPRWNKGELLQKKIWEARVNLMQYFASHAFSQAGQVPWLDATLVLGEQRETESIFSELIPPELGLAREQQAFSMGAVYTSEAGTDLQRIAYSSYCSVSYGSYQDLECDNPAELEVYSSRESLSSTSSFSADTANTFYLRHPELKVATSSLQYSIVLDIVNNLLLYFESEKKKVAHRYEQLRFELQLNNSGKELDFLLTESQNRVRGLASRVRQTEKSMYAAEHGQSDRRPLSGDWVSILSVKSSTRCADLQSQLSQAKEELGSASLDLKLLIKYIKEIEFLKSSCESAEESSVPTTREIDIWLEEVKWVLLQDGQLAIAQIDLAQAFYCVSTNQDGSGEHRFELGSLSVMNLLPNTPFPHALSAYDPRLANPKIDRNSSLRIFLKERAPVGGIYVKEHLEVNLVPLAIRLTKRFYKTIFAYFFQQTSSGKNAEFSDGFSAASDGTSLDLISVSGESVNSELSENLERMKERAEKNKSFIYIKIPDVPISLSYRGNKEKNIEDVRDLECVFGPLEYHNQIYTWKELFVRLKKEIKRLIISQAFKRKIGLKTGIEGVPLLPGSSLNLDTEKAKLIGVRKSPPQNPKRKKKAKKLGSRDSDLSASVPTDESDQSDFTSSLPEFFSIPYNHKPL